MEVTQTMQRRESPGAPKGGPWLERVIVRLGRLGFTDLYHDNLRRRGAAGRLYLLLFGTPHLGSFANGFYLRRVLKKQRFRSALDAGCGDGTFTFYCGMHYPEMKVLGVDIGEQGLHSSESTLDICKRIQDQLQLSNVGFRQLDLLELDAKGEFDFVFSFDVLEHIRENRQVLENIYRAMRTGGVFLLRIPARVQKRVLSEKYTAEHSRWAVIEHLGQHYDMAGLVRDLKEIGFRVREASHTMGLWGRLSFELAEAMKYWRMPEVAYFAAIPIFKFLRILDVLGHPKDGDGLLVVCEK